MRESHIDFRYTVHLRERNRFIFCFLQIIILQRRSVFFCLLRCAVFGLRFILKTLSNALAIRFRSYGADNSSSGIQWQMSFFLFLCLCHPIIADSIHR